MTRLLKIAAWALLVVWLPATAHCRIEAAGLLGSHHDACGDEHHEPVAAECHEDGCPVVEQALIKDQVAAPALAAPAEVLFTLSLAESGSPLLVSRLCPQRHAPPTELAARWHLARRAAPPARAP